MTPLDAVLAIVPSLSKQQRNQVAQAIGKQFNPCHQSGHDYRPVGVVTRWILPPQTKLCCRKCGHVRYA